MQIKLIEKSFLDCFHLYIIDRHRTFYHILPHHNKMSFTATDPPVLGCFSTKPRWGNSKWPNWPTHQNDRQLSFSMAVNCQKLSLCWWYCNLFSNLKLVGGDWSMNLMTFHSVGNFIIPTEQTNSYFSEGWPNHQPVLLALYQLFVYNPIIFQRGRSTTNELDFPMETKLHWEISHPCLAAWISGCRNPQALCLINEPL